MIMQITIVWRASSKAFTSSRGSSNMLDMNIDAQLELSI